MSIYKTVVLLLVFLGANHLFSQTIQGSVKDIEGNKIPGVTFLLQKSRHTTAISEFFTADEEGDFFYQIRESYNTILYITSSTLGHEKKVDSIVSPVKGKIYAINFILSPKPTELEEVILIKERDFRIKKDTVVFNPEAYKDGTEEKVEDLLKKIPGIEVKGNGKISYKGKAVAEVQLDGDDLFGSNYTVGTKNISVDIIEAIEAIENFSKNPLLRGIENSDQVALNLKFKKGKTDYSGNSNIGLGYGDKMYYDVSSTILGVSKKVKSFGVVSFNNVGLNKSSFDYFSTDLTIEEILNRDLYGKKNINVTPDKPGIGDARIRLNNEWSGNYNLIHKINPKLKVRYNVFYVKDRLQSQNSFENSFFTEQEDISFLDNTNIVQKPEQGRFDIKLDYKPTKKSLLEIESSISKQDIQDSVDFQRNLEESSVSNLETEDLFWKNKVLFTQKLDDALVLQFSSLYARNNIPQSFKVDGDFLLGTTNNSRVEQKSEFRKEAFQNYASLLGRKGRLKYSFSVGLDFYEVPFVAALKNQDDEVVSGFQNESDYKKKKYTSNISLSYRLKKLQLSSILGLNYVRQNFEDKLNISNQLFADQLYPKILLNLKYVFNQTSNLSLRGGLNYVTPNENYLFSNNIVTSNRRLTNNLVSLDLSKKYNYRLNYRLDDLARSVELKASVGYSTIEDPYLPSFNINDDVTSQTNFQAPVTNDNLFSELSLSKYLRFLRTTVMHTSSYGISNFNNVVNQSEFRENTSKNYTGDIFFKTSFAIPVNFENNTSYTTATFSSSENFKNTNNSIKNTFRIIYKPNKSWVFSVFNYYYLPNLKNSSNNISFLDFSLRYKSEKLKWLSGSVIGRNLLGTSVFEQVNNSDFSTTIYQSNLIPRYFMLSLDLNF